MFAQRWKYVIYLFICELGILETLGHIQLKIYEQVDVYKG